MTLNLIYQFIWLTIATIVVSKLFQTHQKPPHDQNMEQMELFRHLFSFLEHILLHILIDHMPSISLKVAFLINKSVISPSFSKGFYFTAHVTLPESITNILRILQHISCRFFHCSICIFIKFDTK
ncbi:hypothetical protein ATANTOWER_001537 [Ataeniobius toweri]|uniref:Uncharacterized protein n=1 Tax=Ataeniobius toweri TaxID=208326 RepID=A0ABU7AVH7_9TELE|nr:hypothetical protein [Ataeniobius toweri]